MAYRFTIVGIGEALYDIFEGDERLGGAPLNVAVHAHQLGQTKQGRGVVVSRVGQDARGDRLIRELTERGMTTDFIETDPDRATGRVYVNLNADGHAQYDIVRDAAWDVLQFDPELEDLAQRCDAVCFGSLAQRDAQTRNTIYRFLDACPRAVRMFDVNLRLDEYDSRVIRRSCEMATILKLNEQELPIVLGLTGVDSAEELLGHFDLEMVALTRGEKGTRLYSGPSYVDGEPASYEPAKDADAVGAGDACAAAILVGRILRMQPQRIADLANRVGAYVASQHGATPALPDSVTAML